MRPRALRDSAQRGYDESKALIGHWRGRGRLLGYAITPRFAPTCSPAQLEAAGALWREHPGTAGCDPTSRRTVTRSPGLASSSRPAELRRCVCALWSARSTRHLRTRHPVDRGRAASLLETGTAIAHCPTSNLFLGSGLFMSRIAVKRNVRYVLVSAPTLELAQRFRCCRP